MSCRHCAGFLLFLAAVAWGCSSIPYSKRSLDPGGAESEYERRSGSAEGLKRFALANGYAQEAWPPQRWGLRELTFVALYFHPDMRTARARAAVARTQLESAGLPQALGARLKPEYHGRELPEDNGPWTLGLELEIPLTAEHKREARVARSAFLADAAEIDIAAAAWSVRARVRDRFIELESSRDALASIEAQVTARREVLALVDRRVQAGMLSAYEQSAQRWQLAQLELARDREAAHVQRALGELAQSLGLPLEVVAAMDLRFDVKPPDAFETGAVELRRLALQNRLDVHRKLLEFGAADEEVKLSVAGQNPDITLGPGYSWDQGDNVWSLAVGFSLPSGARARTAIREAEAQRELLAQQFQATQIAAMAATEGAAAQYRSARGRVAAAQRQAQLQQEQEARIVRQFDAGAADRLQRVTARIDFLAAQYILREAQTESTRALAQLEDAVQRPLFGDISTLPDMRAAKPPELSK